MPPKRGAMAQAIRDAYTEDASLEVVDQWSSQAIASLESRAKNAHDARANILAAPYTADAAATVPQVILDSLREYQEHLHGIYRAAETVRTVIGCRIPEFKAEDNLGVEVQMSVLKMIDGLETKLMGSSGDKEGAAPGVAGMYAAREYLSARGAVEDKVLGKEGEDDKKTKSAAPSLLKELQQIDADALVKLELGCVRIASSLRAFVNAYALNWKKLIQPRATTSDRNVC